jgi:putative thioredoxin
VYGKATDDALDIDKQICDSAWLDRAMPHWFKSGGNIREQHSNIAAGVATDYELKSDGHYITALVVDPVSAKKVEHGVLKGFSIGIKNPRVIQDSKAANGRIVDGQIVEVSLVDRPANPNCQLVLAKSASAEDSTIVQVEELIETEETVEETVLQSSTQTQEETQVEKTTAITSAKSILGDLVKFDKTQYEAAREALAPAQSKLMLDARLGALAHWLQAGERKAPRSGDALQAAIESNKRDFEARFELAQMHFAAQRFTQAMDELLEILMRDKTWSDDLARKTYIAILELIEPPKVKVADGQIPPVDPTVATYRRRLSSVVLS